MSDENEVFEVIGEEGEEQSLVLADEIFADEERKQELLEWLREEYHDTVEGGERDDLADDWQTWRRMSMVRPESRYKDYPWPGASNVTTPFMLSNINGVASHIRSALSEKKPRARTKALDAKYADHAKAWEKWINQIASSPLHMNMPRYDRAIEFDLARMGTQVVEVPWEQRRTQFKRKKSDGSVQTVNVVVYEGPGLELYRNEDVITRDDWHDVQASPFVQLRKSYTRTELEQAQYDGFFENVDQIWEVTEEREDSRDDEDEVIGVETALMGNKWADSYEIVKAYATFDGDGDGMAEQLILWYEPSTLTLLRSEFNEVGRRAVVNLGWIVLPGRFWSLGVGWVLQPIQDEIDTLHNIRVNSIHISSLQMYVTPIGSNLKDERFFPLKNIQVPDPSRDFIPIKFPASAQETFQAEEIAKNYGRAVTGISEIQLGMPDTVAKSGTSPTREQFLTQQGNKVLRASIDNAKNGYSEIFTLASLQLVANSDRVLAGRAPLLDLVDKKEAALITEILQMNVEDVPLRFQFVVESTQADETEDAKRQMILTKTQLYSTYVNQAIQLQMMVANPQAPPELKQFVQQLLVGQTKMIEESLRLFDVEDAESYTPNLRLGELMIEMLQLQQEPMLEQLEERIRRMKGEESEGDRPGGAAFQPGYTRLAGDGPGAGMAGAAGNAPS